MQDDRLKLLIIDDDESCRGMASVLLSRDFRVFMAENGKKGIESYKEYRPDIVFLDILMPVQDGYETMHEILGINPNAFIVMFSSNANMDSVKRTLTKGAKGFITKPFSRSSFDTYIKLYEHNMKQKEKPA